MKRSRIDSTRRESGAGARFVGRAVGGEVGVVAAAVGGGENPRTGVHGHGWIVMVTTMDPATFGLVQLKVSNEFLFFRKEVISHP